MAMVARWVAKAAVAGQTNMTVLSSTVAQQVELLAKNTTVPVIALIGQNVRSLELSVRSFSASVGCECLHADLCEETLLY